MHQLSFLTILQYTSATGSGQELVMKNELAASLAMIQADVASSGENEYTDLGLAVRSSVNVMDTHAFLPSHLKTQCHHRQLQHMRQRQVSD